MTNLEFIDFISLTMRVPARKTSRGICQKNTSMDEKVKEKQVLKCSRQHSPSLLEKGLLLKGTYRRGKSQIWQKKSARWTGELKTRSIQKLRGKKKNGKKKKLRKDHVFKRK